MPVVGTAGHVDHGKSTLVQRLTGRDPDRWEEEKRRGLTIDLGFAWAEFPSGTEVSFVDVPGHERFLKNMLAGIEAIDVALFVVAADEGWMPQSEEHLAVLDLLQVDHGVVAVTKADLVDSDLLELAELEVMERLAGTSLAGSEVIAVSSHTGTGLEDLVSALDSQVQGVAPRNLGRPRLWVDRSFSAAGAGTVVTGTLLDGPLSVETSVTVYPTGKTARVRGIQSHEQTMDQVEPGRRVALNLGGLERQDAKRGSLIGLPGHWATSDRFAARVRGARYVEELDRRGAYHIHIGSGAHPLGITAIREGLAVLQTMEPIPMASGDRFIIRDTGRKLVVGGGQVLDPDPGPTRDAMDQSAGIRLSDGPDSIAQKLLELRGSESLESLLAQTLGGRPAKAREIDGFLLSEGHFGRLLSRAQELVAKDHQDYPLRAGIPLATLAERLGISVAVAEDVVTQSSSLERVGPDVATAGRSITLDKRQAEDWAKARAELSAGLAVPSVGELGLDPELLHLQVRRGELVKVDDNLAFLSEQIEAIRRMIAEMPDGFTVADFRDAAGLSRKYAVPILEWADKEGLTIRRGDTRTTR